MRFRYRWLLSISIVLMIGGAIWLLWSRFETHIKPIRIGVLELSGDDADLLKALNQRLITNKSHFRIELVPVALDSAQSKLDNKEIDMMSVRSDKFTHSGFSTVVTLYHEAAFVGGFKGTKFNDLTNNQNKPIALVA